MNKTKVVTLLFGIIMLIAGILIGVTLVQKNQDVREKAAPSTSMYISPSSQSVSPNTNFNFIVKPSNI